jgi:Xaa-Pro dipeptidase
MTDAIFHPPTAEEIARRIALVQQRMEEQALDWYLCFDPDNVYYLTNFANFVHERPFILLIPASGRPTFVAPKLEIPHINSRKVGEIDLVDYFEFPAPARKGWADRVNKVIGRNAMVGLESTCQLQIHDGVRAERICTDIVDELRLIKSPYEIGRMTYAGRIVSAAMADMLAQAEVGRSLHAVMAAGKGLMLGALMQDDPSINPLATRADAVFQPPRYSDDPHNFTNLAMEMEAGGPHVGVINAVLNGYGSEVERTFFIGHVPEAAKQPFEAMMAARELAFSMVKPGICMGDVDRAVNALFRKRGCTDYLLHRTGHGMGVTGHEAPFLAEGDSRIIEPGMSFTIEPGIYLPGIGGFRHSDTIVVTETGNVSLTSAPDSLEALTL